MIQSKSCVALLVVVMLLAVAVAQEDAPFRFTVSAAGRIAMGEEELDWSGIDRLLTDPERTASGALIVADPEAPFDTVLALTFMCADAWPAVKADWAVLTPNGAGEPRTPLLRWPPENTYSIMRVKLEGETISGLDGEMGTLSAVTDAKATLEEYRDWEETDAALLEATGTSFRNLLKFELLCREAGFKTVCFARPELPLEILPARSAESQEGGWSEIAEGMQLPEVKSEHLLALPGDAVVIGVTEDRRVFLDGTEANEEFLGFSLKDRGRMTLEPERELEADAPASARVRLSKSNILIRGDARSLWRDVRDVLSACAAGRIYRIYWAVKNGETTAAFAAFLSRGPVRVELDRDGRVKAGQPVVVTLHLRRGAGGSRTLATLGTDAVGPFEPGCPGLVRALPEWKAEGRRTIVFIDAWDAVPFGEVLEAYRLLTENGADEVGLTFSR